MSSEKFTSYWIGEEPTGWRNSPKLNEMPSYVDVVPLAFVYLKPNGEMDFSFLCKQNKEGVIKKWVKELRKKGLKVILSIHSGGSAKFQAIPDSKTFAENVKSTLADWEVDGVDIDFEPPIESPKVLEIVKQLRETLGSGALMTAPIYEPWIKIPRYLKEFATQFDYLTMMDYTPYPGFDKTIDLFEDYAEVIGRPEKLAIGVSCMGPPVSNNFTPLEDVIKLCQWKPEHGKKQGVMLYTSSYDVNKRKSSGTGYKDGTWAKTIHENLP